MMYVASRAWSDVSRCHTSTSANDDRLHEDDLVSTATTEVTAAARYQSQAQPRASRVECTGLEF